MAVDDYDDKTGRPIFLGGSAPQTAIDLTAVGQYAAEVGTRLIGTTAQRNAYKHARKGLAWYDTDLGETMIHNGSGWQSADPKPQTIKITPWGDLWRFDYPGWLPGAIRRERHRVFMQGMGSNRKTVAIGATGEYQVATIPVEHAPRQAVRFATTLGRGFVAGIEVDPNGKITLFTHDDIDPIHPGFCTFYLDGMSWPAKD